MFHIIKSLEMRYFTYAFLMLGLMISPLPTSLIAQSLEFTKSPSGPVNFDLDADVAKINLHVKNIGSSPVRVWVTMDTSKMFPAHRAYFCWEQCYSFGVVDARNIAGGKPLTLRPGQDTNAFTAYVDHYAVFNEPKAGTSTLTFDFFNEDDPSDRISKTLVFNIGNTTQVLEESTAKDPILWNPTTRSFFIDDTFNGAELDLYSINGEYFKNVQSYAKILPIGIYGYILRTSSGVAIRGIVSIY